MELTFVTSNRQKFEEAEEALEKPLKHKNLELEEVQSVDTEEVAIRKAKDAYEELERPVIVEDTGLYFEELDGFPGALAKHALKGLGNEGLCKLVNVNRSAKAVTTIAFCNGDTTETFTGSVKGEVVESSRGFGGFGWDPVFSPEGFDKTFAEMSDEKKMNTCMRKKAFEKFAEKLN